jgi:hypothetical protein
MLLHIAPIAEEDSVFQIPCKGQNSVLVFLASDTRNVDLFQARDIGTYAFETANPDSELASAALQQLDAKT